ncbi:MAG: helix-turn-helix domain-containing protein [Burkholderiaceae bacterium]|nr:helix-turn-helix domain-containing protein [Burkholderiaceae bacterium]
MSDKLGDFIRAHRERVTPGECGLPVSGRRRTPGLRREELAQLCEVSPTWLTWLEQGRPVSASGKMLARLAEALRLSTAERAYLFKLADKLDPSAEQDTPVESGEEFAAIVAAIAVPAYILDRSWNAVAWNEAAAHLFAGWLSDATADVPKQPNLLRFMFCAPQARKLIVDWNERAKRLVAEFRADCGKHADRDPLADLIVELQRASKDFRQYWQAQDVVEREGGLRRFKHPLHGALRFNQTTFYFARRRDLKLVMLY